LCQLLENLLDPLRLRCNSWACVAHLLIPGKSIPGNLKIPPQSGDVGFRTCKSLALEKGPHDGRIGHSLTGDGGRSPTGRYVGNRATLATDPSGLIVRQVGDFLWGVGQGIVEVPAMFLDLGHSVGALAYMEITGRPYIPTYLSMTAQAADRASVQGGREAIGEMLANAYFDLFTFGVRPLFQALQEAVHGNCEPLGQFSGMLIFGWAVGGGGFRPQQITLPEGPRPVLALAGGGEVALAAPGGLAIPVPHGLPMPIIVHMTVPEGPNGNNQPPQGGEVAKGTPHPNAAQIIKLHAERVRNQINIEKLQQALDNIRDQQPTNAVDALGHDAFQQARIQNIMDNIAELRARNLEIDGLIDRLLGPAK